MSNRTLKYPADLDCIRSREYPKLQETTYLDHAGTTIYANSLVLRISEDLSSNLFGNPHSASPSSELSSLRVENVRSRVLNFFKADPNEFDVVFVANATAAIKLVADAFRDYNRDVTEIQPPKFFYHYHRDCHTSLVGVRELATQSYCFQSNEAVEKWLAGKHNPVVDFPQANDRSISLFAYPAQSNMNGHRLPPGWPGQIRRSPQPEHRSCYTLLDASAYVTTAQLDLSDSNTTPDFVALSFYKIFGLPDLGCLLVRKDAGHILQKRKYFGGGTVNMVIVLDNEWHAKKDGELHEQLEDGTLAFHNIIALDSALDVHENIYGSMDSISRHTAGLAKVMYDELASLRHASGVTVCEIYKDKGSIYGDSKTQGPTIAFNIRDSRGNWVGKTTFEQLAIAHNIQLRTGGLCNSGGIAASLGLSSTELRNNYAEGVRCGNDIDIMNGKPTGVIRASLGAMSTLQDVEILVSFMKTYFVEGKAQRITAEKHAIAEKDTTMVPTGCTPFHLQWSKLSRRVSGSRGTNPWFQSWLATRKRRKACRRQKKLDFDEARSI
ncbi:hypothetical protein MMC30_001350 [Trapelia coarctata]|nr:hypothetical protein [Trapelia coarctata]